MAYTKTNWENGKTPINATNLNNIEQGIANNETAAKNAVGLVIKDADKYSTTATYAVGAIVLYNNKLYECITAITKGEAFTSSKWKQVYVKDLIAGLKTDMGNVGALLDTINGEVV